MEPRVYFLVYFDEKGVLHIAPRDGVERMALKHFEYEVGEHGLEKMVSIDTDMAVRLPAPYIPLLCSRKI